MANIVFIVTHHTTAATLLAGELAWLRGRGHDVRVITSRSEHSDSTGVVAGVPVVPVTMCREMAPLQDLLSLIRLIRVLSALSPDVVNASTPKAGLLGMLAATVARVPGRMYVLRGLRLETSTGLKRILLRAAERVACALADEVVCVSPSLRRRAVEEGVVHPDVALVLRHGSSGGVDSSRFRPRDRGDPEVVELRRRLGLLPESSVVVFIGRITRDKGVEDLWCAFRDHVLPRCPEARLLLVGAEEPGDPIDGVLREELRASHQVVATESFVNDTAPYHALATVFAFPSYREGFPNAPLEAAATGVPVVGYDATGTVDAVVDGVTGTLVRRGDSAAFGRALVRYLTESEVRHQHGLAGRGRVCAQFQPEMIRAALEERYVHLAARRRRRAPAWRVSSNEG